MTNAHEGNVVEPGKNQFKKSYYLQFRATISTFERDSLLEHLHTNRKQYASKENHSDSTIQFPDRMREKKKKKKKKKIYHIKHSNLNKEDPSETPNIQTQIIQVHYKKNIYIFLTLP
jgi:hypothetical protein